MYKILDNKNKSVFSNKVESKIEVELSTKVRSLPGDNVLRELSLMEQYNKERDNCDKFRLILTVNPLCSNVLYNAKTEIVINEGSSNAIVLLEGNTLEKNVYAPNATNTTSEIDYLTAIRNTEYSHPELGSFTYHCGYNIFNNHMLRNDGFVHVNKRVEGDGNVYNTLLDYMRNGEGNIVQQDINMDNSTGLTKMHLYRFDSTITMKTAFYEKCKERDGWWGFYNPSYINIPNRENKNILTNTLIASKKPCEFIDLYPDRSLYSFIPKYNPYKNRIEKNWDYCITYPYKNNYELINTICGADNYSIKVNFIKKFNSNGIEILECNSYFNHNLKPSDYINVYYKPSGNDKLQKFGKSIKIESIGDSIGENKDKIFNIKFSSIVPIWNDIQSGYFFFKKVNGQEECQYYFREFKKLKNSDNSELKSDINKIAFGKNIYGDDVAQVIFTDDIDVSELVDNRNRPVSEIYFTVVKRNAGYKEWYNDNNISSDTIEYSHCFGKVTSGLDFSGMKEEPFDYNVHRLHNISKNNSNNEDDRTRTIETWGDAVLSKPATLEDDITIERDVFFGDVVEYDSFTAKETILSNVYHRVNTAQRETFNTVYKNIVQDSFEGDDYDSAFTITTYFLNNNSGSDTKYEENTVNSVNVRANGEKDLIHGNIMPEGSYYKPHSLIEIRAKDNVVSEAPAKLVNYGECSIKNDTIEIIYPTNYGFYKGDYIAFFEKEKSKTHWCEITGVNEKESKLTIKLNDSLEKREDYFLGNLRIYYAYWSPNNAPIYADLLPKSRKFTWRKLVPQSELSSTNSLYDTTFANGRLYIEKNINFFLRRQDPFGKYGLSTPIFNKTEQKSNPLDDFTIKGDKQIDFTHLLTSFNNLDSCY